MGKISVEGRSSKRVDADFMSVSIRFMARANSEARAISKVKSECEEYLKEISELGIDITNVQDSGESIRYDYNEEKVVVRAEKPIVLESSINIPVANKLIDILKDSNYSASVNVNYSLADSTQLEEELIKEAVLDSKRKAELIATSTNQTISGIDEVRNSGYYDSKPLYGECPDFLMNEYVTNTPLADSLAPPIVEEEKELTVVWLIE